MKSLGGPEAPLRIFSILVLKSQTVSNDILLQKKFDVTYLDYGSDFVLHPSYIGFDITRAFHELCRDGTKPDWHTHERPGYAD